MPKFKKDENVLDIESSEDASRVPGEEDAENEGEKSDAQAVADGDIVLDSGEDDLVAPTESDVPETTEQEDKEEKEEKPGDKKPADESEDVKPEDDAKEEDKKEKTPPKKAAAPDKVQTRINKITREKYDAIREKDRLETENAALKGQLKDSTDAKELAELEGQKPKLEDFDTEGEYYEKLGRWGVKIEMREEKARTKDAPKKPDTEDKTEDPREAIIALGEEAYPDFMEKVSAIPISEAMFEAAQDSEHTVDILYALADRPEDAKRIAAMKSPVSVAREIGRIETLFDDGEVSEVTVHKPDEDMEDKIKKKNLSNAPKPVKPLGGGGKVSKERDNMSISEYRASRGYTRDGDLKVVDPRVA